MNALDFKSRCSLRYLDMRTKVLGTQCRARIASSKLILGNCLASYKKETLPLYQTMSYAKVNSKWVTYMCYKIYWKKSEFSTIFISKESPMIIPLGGEERSRNK